MNDKYVFGKSNNLLLIAGVILLLAGYVIMSQGDITVSPLLLIIAYLIIIPLSISWGVFMGKKKKSTEESVTTSAGQKSKSKQYARRKR